MIKEKIKNKKKKKLSLKKKVALLMILAVVAAAYHYSYVFYTPDEVDFTLLSKKGKLKITVPGRYVNIVTRLFFPRRKVLKGGDRGSIALNIPYVEMPVIEGYQIPIPDDPYNRWRTGYLRVRASSGDHSIENWNLKKLKTKTTGFDKFVEVDSEYPDLRAFRPKNRAQMPGSAGKYVVYLSHDNKYLIDCRVACGYDQHYAYDEQDSRRFMSYSFTFRKIALPHYLKVDASVRALLQQFLDNAKN